MSTHTNMPGEEQFYAVTNGEIYKKVMELEKHIIKITTVFSVVAFIITPVLSVVASTMIHGMIGDK